MVEEYDDDGLEPSDDDTDAAEERLDDDLAGHDEVQVAAKVRETSMSGFVWLVIVAMGVGIWWFLRSDERDPEFSAPGNPTRSVGLAPAGSAPVASAFPLTESELADHIIETFRSSRWGGTISVTYDRGAVRVSYTLDKPRPRMTRRANAKMVRELVQRAIDGLMKRGHDPKTQMTYISAYVWQPVGKSPTGRSQKHSFVMAHYDFNYDRIVVEALQEP